MNCYEKQRCAGGGSAGWDWGSELDMSVGPGTVIRPDLPLGSGPAKESKAAAGVFGSSCGCGETQVKPVTLPGKIEECPSVPMCPEFLRERGAPPPELCPCRGKHRCGEVASGFFGEDIDRYPVAMAYVPWQKWQQVYSVESALYRGTIFPELDQSFIMEGCRR